MTVNSYLDRLASRLVLSDAEEESIKTSTNSIGSRLDSYFGGLIADHFKFGSYTRRTILPRLADEESDIDYMVVFCDGSYRPQTYLDRLKTFAERYYTKSEIHQSSPTIVLELQHIKFELVPAHCGYSGGEYYIPDGKGGWMSTYPRQFDSLLRKVNQEHNYQIKPAIRLIKHWNINKNKRALSSYQIEQKITEALRYSTPPYGRLVDYVGYAQTLMRELAFFDNFTLQRVDHAIEYLKIALKYESIGLPDRALSVIQKVFPYV